MLEPVISYPFGNLDQQSVPFAVNMTLTIGNQKTQTTITQMTAASTLNITAAKGLRAGADVTVKLEADGTNRTVTMGLGVLGLPITVNAGKTKYAVFIYDGATFVNTASNQVN